MVSEGDELDEKSEAPKEQSLAEMVGELLSSEPEIDLSPVRNDIANKKKKFKPRGLFLGHRRDTGKEIDIQPMVLARHAAMLG